jgi:hypothetical protein
VAETQTERDTQQVILTVNKKKKKKLASVRERRLA